MLHICRTIRRNFSLRQVVHWSAEIEANVYDPREEGRKEGLTDRTIKRVNSRSLTELLFHILQNSRKKRHQPADRKGRWIRIR